MKLKNTTTENAMKIAALAELISWYFLSNVSMNCQSHIQGSCLNTAHVYIRQEIGMIIEQDKIVT